MPLAQVGDVASVAERDQRDPVDDRHAIDLMEQLQPRGAGGLAPGAVDQLVQLGVGEAALVGQRVGLQEQPQAVLGIGIAGQPAGDVDLAELGQRRQAGHILGPSRDVPDDPRRARPARPRRAPPATGAQTSWVATVSSAAAARCRTRPAQPPPRRGSKRQRDICRVALQRRRDDAAGRHRQVAGQHPANASRSTASASARRKAAVAGERVGVAECQVRRPGRRPGHGGRRVRPAGSRSRAVSRRGGSDRRCRARTARAPRRCGRASTSTILTLPGCTGDARVGVPARAGRRCARPAGTAR